MTTWHLATFEPQLKSQTIDGATQYSFSLGRHLQESGFLFEPHLFEDTVAAQKKFACFLQEHNGIVLSSIGPYAYLYHYIREKFNLDFPIVRDIHGGAWTGYLMQEWLCSSLTRPGDAIIFPSHYSRSLFADLFPRCASKARLLVAHPRYQGSQFPPWKPKQRDASLVKIGCIGRLSHDKNVLEMINAVLIIQKRHPQTRIELHLIGGEYDLTMKSIRKHWIALGGDQDKLIYWGTKLPQELIDLFYKTIDVLAFFSTSNVETLGRVVIEARHACVPVCMARHAAARELVDARCQIPVHYFSRRISCHNCEPMGEIDPKIAAIMLWETATKQIPPTANNEQFHFEPFTNMLKLLAKSQLPDTLTNVKPVAHKLHISLCEIPEKQETMDVINYLRNHFKYWLGLSLRDKRRLKSELLERTKDMARSKHFLETVHLKQVNYSDLAAFPFNLAQLCNFHPTVNPEKNNSMKRR